MRATPGNISDMEGPKQLQPDQSILEHKAKREIELAVAKEQAKLEDEGWVLQSRGRVGLDRRRAWTGGEYPIH